MHPASSSSTSSPREHAVTGNDDAESTPDLRAQCLPSSIGEEVNREPASPDGVSLLLDKKIIGNNAAGGGEEEIEAGASGVASLRGGSRASSKEEEEEEGKEEEEEVVGDEMSPSAP